MLCSASALAVIVAIVVFAALRASRHIMPLATDGTAHLQSADPLNAELIRCRSIGIAAQDDHACLAAWSENRQRFFGDALSSSSRTQSSVAVRPQRTGH